MPAKWINIKRYQSADRLRLLEGGRGYFDLLEKLILEAQEEIHLQTYVFGSDSTGKRILDALLIAAEKGVRVFMMLDAFGSKNLDRKFVRRMERSAIELRWFGPLFSKNLGLWRRLHHKVVVVDRRFALIGGINISDRYNDVGDSRAWLDFAILLEGPIALEARAHCLQIFEKKIWRPKTEISTKQASVPVRLRVNDWLRGKAQITSSFINAIRQAQDSLIIFAAYFMPTTSLMNVLRKASARGVAVQMVFGRTSDVWISKRATRYLYNWLLRHDIKIYEWKPTVLHAKVAVVDDSWATIGSYNLDFLSIFESIELNVNIADQAFAAAFGRRLQEIMDQECDRISFDVYQKTERSLRRFLDRLSFYLYWLLVRLFFLIDRRPADGRRIPWRKMLVGGEWWEEA